MLRKGAAAVGEIVDSAGISGPTFHSNAGDGRSATTGGPVINVVPISWISTAGLMSGILLTDPSMKAAPLTKDLRSTEPNRG